MIGLEFYPCFMQLAPPLVRTSDEKKMSSYVHI